MAPSALPCSVTNPSSSIEAMSVVRIQSSLIEVILASNSPRSPAASSAPVSWSTMRSCGIGQRPADAVALGRTELAVHIGCPRAERAGEFGCAVSQLDRNAVARLELVSGLRVQRTRRADQEFQRGQVLLGHVGIEQHADDRGLHARALDAVRLHRVDPTVDGEPLEDDDPPAVVGACDQLTDPDAAELPVGELGRGARRSRLAAGDAEHGAFQHRRLDRLPLGRAGGAARQNLQCHTGFGLGMPAGLVAALQSRDGGDGGRPQRERDARTARPLGGRDDRVGPVLLDRRRSPTGSSFSMSRPIDFRRLERVDHRDRYDRPR